MGNDRNPSYRSHPSYGMVQFVRTNGHVGRLFGSSIRDHHATIRLVVSRAEVKFDLSCEWYYAGDRLIEVELSAVQFAELLTAMNVGSGVPCTICHLIGGGKVEEPPDDETEVERVRHGFSKYTEKVSQRYSEFTDAVARALHGSSKKARDEVAKATQLLHQVITADMPFAAEQFQRATDKVVAAAKAEIDAFITHAIAKTGLHVLKNYPEAAAQMMLEDHAADED